MVKASLTIVIKPIDSERKPQAPKVTIKGTQAAITPAWEDVVNRNALDSKRK